MARRIARECAVIGFFLLLTVALTWPMARDLRTAIADPGDPYINVWILDWVSHALTHAPLDLFDAPIFHPAEKSLAFSENLVGVALFVLPLHLAGVHPIAIYNIAFILGFALSGYGAFVLARLLTQSAAAALIAGIFYAFVSFRFDHLSHMQLAWSGWIPLLLAAVIAYWRRPSARAAVIVAVAFAMNGLTNIHYLLFGTVSMAIAIAVMAIVDPRRGRAFWVRLAAAFVVASFVLLPFLLPYRHVAEKYEMKRHSWEAAAFSAPLESWLVATPRSALYGRLGPPELHRHEMQLFPGLFAIFVALAGVLLTPRIGQTGPHRAIAAPRLLRAIDVCIVLTSAFVYVGMVTKAPADVSSLVLLLLVTARLTLRYPIALGGAEGFSLRGAASRSRFSAGAWASAVLVLVGVLGSMGMKTFFHAFLFRRLEVFQAIRVPARWAIIAYVGLAVWVAIGAAALLRRYEGRRRVAAAVLLIALAVVDVRPTLRWAHAQPVIAPVYRWLAHERPGVILELPLTGDGIEYKYLLGETKHRLPTLNGVSGFEPPLYRELKLRAERADYDALLSLAEANGAQVIVLHAHAMKDRSWLPHLLESGRLAPLRSFDHEAGGDWAFAVTKNLPGWQRLREPDVPDPAGHQPGEKLSRMIAGAATHSEAIVAVVETPANGSVISGPLHVRGWALSPFGIRRATILIQSGKVRIDAVLVPREEIRKSYGWYYHVPNPGFERVIDERPHGVPRSTQFQVEIEDQQGRITRTDDVFIEWQ